MAGAAGLLPKQTQWPKQLGMSSASPREPFKQAKRSCRCVVPSAAPVCVPSCASSVVAACGSSLVKMDCIALVLGNPLWILLGI